MELLTSTGGSFPRPDSSDEALQQVIDDQIAAGVDILTDGLIGCDDPISRFMDKMDGVEPGRTTAMLARLAPYRRPRVQMTAMWREPITSPAYALARKASPRPVKAIITGPLTLASCSEMMAGSYNDLGEFTFDLARSLAREVEGLAEAGAPVIQIDEPNLPQHPEQMDALRDSLELLRDYAGEAELVLKVYWGEVAGLYDRLQELPVDRLDLDFVSDPELTDIVANQGSDKPLSIALLDGRDGGLEEESDMLKRLERILKRIDGEKAQLTINGGFVPFLNREKASAKLRHLVCLRDRFLR